VSLKFDVYIRITYRSIAIQNNVSDYIFQCEGDRVTNSVEIEVDGNFFWSSVSEYEDKDLMPGIGSLREDTPLQFLLDPFNGNIFMQQISKDEFFGWLETAKKSGKLRLPRRLGK